MPQIKVCEKQFVTDRQTESDAYEPTVQYAQVGSKSSLFGPLLLSMHPLLQKLWPTLDPFKQWPGFITYT